MDVCTTTGVILQVAAPLKRDIVCKAMVGYIYLARHGLELQEQREMAKAILY